MMRKPTAPTMMPAITPPDNGWWWPSLPVDDDVGVDVADDNDALASEGILSPGATMKSASFAAIFCVCRVCDALGFMTPTI